MTLPDETPPGQVYDEDHHPRQRKSDQGARYWAGSFYRHVLPALCLIVAGGSLWQGIDATSTAKHAVTVANGKADRAELKANRAAQEARNQREGRAVAVDVLCGGLAGVEDAGRRALEGTLKGQNGQGLPRVAIRDYVSIINGALLKQAGIEGRGVLKRNGQIDCDAVRVRAKATHP